MRLHHSEIKSLGIWKSQAGFLPSVLALFSVLSSRKWSILSFTGPARSRRENCPSPPLPLLLVAEEEDEEGTGTGTGSGTGALLSFLFLAVDRAVMEEEASLADRAWVDRRVSILSSGAASPSAPAPTPRPSSASRTGVFGGRFSSFKEELDEAKGPSSDSFRARDPAASVFFLAGTAFLGLSFN